MTLPKQNGSVEDWREFKRRVSNATVLRMGSSKLKPYLHRYVENTQAFINM